MKTTREELAIIADDVYDNRYEYSITYDNLSLCNRFGVTPYMLKKELDERHSFNFADFRRDYIKLFILKHYRRMPVMQLLAVLNISPGYALKIAREMGVVRPHGGDRKSRTFNCRGRRC